MNRALTELKEAIISADSKKVDNILQELDPELEITRIFEDCVYPALDSLCVSIKEKRGAVPELLMGLKQVQRITETRCQQIEKRKQKVIMGVVEGDIHDMGKNVIRDVCKGYGYTVVDLGKDVTPQKFVDAACNESADIACLSTMMSTTMDSLKGTISMLKASRPGIRVIIGGAFINDPLARDLNADGYAKDASTVMAEFDRILQ